LYCYICNIVIKQAIETAGSNASEYYKEKIYLADGDMKERFMETVYLEN